MKTTLSKQALATATAQLGKANRAFTAAYPGESGGRQPVHCFYGGAHLFRADVAKRLGELALRSLEDFAPDPDTLASALGLPGSVAGEVYSRIAEKLRREPV